MRNIKLTIEYDGTRYAGWQVQNSHKSQVTSHKLKTIQHEIETALYKMLHKKIYLHASGRTDAGVHARAQVANFRTGSRLTPDKLRIGLNALLPEDISVLEAEEAQEAFHSRFSAKSKVYRYTILNRSAKPAILRQAVYFYPYPLNVKLMRKEARVLLGRHDFKSFQAADKRKRGAVRRIKRVEVKRDKEFIHIDLEAEGFLYNMARNIAGTLVEIGRGRFPEGSMKTILLAKNRKFAGPTLPAKGLCLLKVMY